MKIMIVCVVVGLLSGCATCQRHPVVCAVGFGLVAGSIAASQNHSSDDRHIPTPGVTCIPASVCQ